MEKLGEELVASGENAPEDEKSCSDPETESFLFLPPETVFEIISRLPVKSLLVFKTVCKLWCSMIEDRKFVEVHMKRSNTIYVCKEKGDTKEFECLAVKDGLLVEKHRITKKYRIQNPATKYKLDLPDPHHNLKYTKLVYLPSTDTYKLINVYGKKGSRLGGCEVLSIGTDMAWRTLDIPSFYDLNRRRMKGSYGSIDDRFYYMRFSSHQIVCLEMDSESFKILKVPQALFQSWDSVVPISWDKKLSLAKVLGLELHVWVLEDYKKQTWGERKRIISLSFLSNYPNITEKPKPRTFSKGRLQFRSHEDHRIAYYVESGKVHIKYVPEGEKIDYIMHHTLVNPLGVETNRTNKNAGVV
ncbi:OLC1v1021876C1 [Oldenlandia corymbosa var. corymbosa]|uniref:OLC1v1021876C1 n=1 Tax=Oldenlandia corymbosa var. corymbosa TaxID=529605 RepID=A0AAV1BZ96_OLDCO|nr:OLC1v1021876C1 [Oldenlandia corymbosa var. corymbosa]